MKAMRFHSYGDSDVLVLEEAERPVAARGQVVVQVAATAFNPVDVPIRAGVVKEVFPVAFPHIPNYDVAGVVDEVGEGVVGWEVGDPVVAFLPMTAPGAAAEYVAVPADTLAAAPHTTGDLAEAAALPSVGVTAWQSLFEHADLKPGQNILINGAGGGVGRYAVQLASRAGAIVTATASARSRHRVGSYGAKRVIDYTATPVPEAAAGERFDIVLHLVRTGPEETAALAELVADGGAFVSTTVAPPEDLGRGVRAVQVFARNDADQLAELVRRVDAGELRIDVAERRPISDLAAVHDLAYDGELEGRTILIP